MYQRWTRLRGRAGLRINVSYYLWVVEGATLDFVELPDDILVVHGKVTDLAECIRRRVRPADLAVPAGGFDGNDRAHNDDPTYPPHQPGTQTTAVLGASYPAKIICTEVGTTH